MVYSALTVILALPQALQLLAPTDSPVYPQHLDDALSCRGLLVAWLFALPADIQRQAVCGVLVWAAAGQHGILARLLPHQ